MYSKEEKKQIKTDFWNGFSEYCSRISRLVRRPFILYNTKMKGVELKFDVRRDSVDVVLEINGWRREEKYEQIAAYKVIFENAFSRQRPMNHTDNGLLPIIYAPSYTRESGEEVSRIYVSLTGLDFHRREQWPLFYEFMAWRMMAMEHAFREIKEAISDEM